jgi:hypothetical protein
MKLDWRNMLDQYHAQAITDFAVLRVGVDMCLSRIMETLLYEARLDKVSGAQIGYQTDFESVQAAKDWCVAEYKRLLRAELEWLT